MPDDKYIALLLEAAGKTAQSYLTSFLRSSSMTPICYASKLRVKDEEKLLKKVKRKGKVKKGYQLKDITDLVGLRLVTLFRNDMPDVFQKTMDAINHVDSPTPNPFLKGSAEETIIYTTDPTYDKIIPAIRDSKAAQHLPLNIEESGGRYSSIHIVARLDDANIKELSNIRKKLGKKYNLPIEIQIRTVFEDAWGEIDHKYGYVVREGRETGTPINNAEHVSVHLKVLKKYTDACAEYADIIAEEANPSVSKIRSPEKIISVASDDDIIAKFETLGIDERLIVQYVDARAIKEDAISEYDSDIGKGIAGLMQAAEDFRGILGDTTTNPCDEKDNYGGYLFYYYVKMNEAVCLLTTNLLDNTKKANSIYTHLEAAYGRFPLLSMRLAQSLGKAGKLDQAIEKYLEGSKLMLSLVGKNMPTEEWPDELPETDYNHMKKSIPRLLGYHYWMKAAETNDKALKLILLQQAYETTEELSSVVDSDEDIRKMHNNLLYYAVEYLNIENHYEK